MKKVLLVFMILLSLLKLTAQPNREGKTFPIQETSVHDPVMIKHGDTYYVFCTGFGACRNFVSKC